MSKPLGFLCRLVCVDKRRLSRLTNTFRVIALCYVVDAHVDSPGGQITKYHGSKTSIHSLETILAHDCFCSSNKASVDLGG